jgi:hypothetical protein
MALLALTRRKQQSGCAVPARPRGTQGGCRLAQVVPATYTQQYNSFGATKRTHKEAPTENRQAEAAGAFRVPAKPACTQPRTRISAVHTRRRPALPRGAGEARCPKAPSTAPAGPMAAARGHAKVQPDLAHTRLCPSLLCAAARALWVVFPESAEFGSLQSVGATLQTPSPYACCPPAGGRWWHAAVERTLQARPAAEQRREEEGA